MVDHNHYVPILWGRGGEYGALKAMSPEVKAKITPVLEVPPIQWDFKNRKPAKTIDAHLQKLSGAIKKAWGIDRPAFISPSWIERERMCDGTHPLTHILLQAEKDELQLIPVTGLGKDEDYQRACRDIIGRSPHGVCLRLQREDFEESPDLGSQVSSLLRALGVSPEETDLILDLRALGKTEGSTLSVAVPALIRGVPRLQEWRSFTLAGTAFPATLVGYPPSKFSEISRLEWLLWRNIVSRSKVPRLPAFGDYGISHTDPSEADFRVMRPSASIRYTAEEKWLVPKGKNLRDYGFDQFYGVCRGLIRRREYTGPGFSWGDWYINECANKRVTTGNLMTWRKVGTSHHIAFVVNQIANLS